MINPNLSDSEIQNLKKQGFTDDIISQMIPANQSFNKNQQTNNQQNVQSQNKNDENVTKLNEYSQNLIKALNGLIKELEKFSKDSKENSKKEKEDKEDYLQKLKGINESLWTSLESALKGNFQSGAEQLLSTFTKGAGIWGRVLSIGFETWKQFEQKSASANKYELSRLGLENINELDDVKALENVSSIKKSLNEVGQLANYDRFMGLYREILNPKIRENGRIDQQKFVSNIGSYETLFQAQGAESGQATQLATSMMIQGVDIGSAFTSLINVLNKTKNFEQAMPKATDNIIKLYQATAKYDMTMEDSVDAIKHWDKELRKGIITISDIAQISSAGRNMGTGRAAGLAQMLINSGAELPKEMMEAADEPIKLGFIFKQLLSKQDKQVMRAIQDFGLKETGDRYKGAYYAENLFGDLLTQETVMQMATGKSIVAPSTSLEAGGEINQLEAQELAKKVWEKTSTTLERTGNDLSTFVDDINTELARLKKAINEEAVFRQEQAEKLRDMAEDEENIVKKLVLLLGASEMSRTHYAGL